MQKKILIGTGVAIVFGLAALLFSAYLVPQSAQAEEDKVNVTSLHWDSYVARPIRPTPDMLAPQPTPLEELQALVAKGALPTNKAGWIYIKSTTDYDSDLPNNGTLSNGQAIPNHFTSEDWLHLDDQQQVFESVSIMRSLDGQIIQVGVFSNGTVWNSATGESYPLTPWKLGLLDNGFSKEVQRHIGITTLEKANTQLNGLPLTLFVMRETYNKPTQSADFKQPSLSSEQRAYFDPVTGQLRLSEMVVNLADGTERVFSRGSTDIQFDALPPAEVLNYFAMKENEK